MSVSMEWEERTRTLLVSYDSHAKAVEVTAQWVCIGKQALETLRLLIHALIHHRRDDIRPPVERQVVPILPVYFARP